MRPYQVGQTGNSNFSLFSVIASLMQPKGAPPDYTGRNLLPMNPLLAQRLKLSADGGLPANLEGIFEEATTPAWEQAPPDPARPLAANRTRSDLRPYLNMGNRDILHALGHAMLDPIAHDTTAAAQARRDTPEVMRALIDTGRTDARGMFYGAQVLSALAWQLSALGRAALGKCPALHKYIVDAIRQRLDRAIDVIAAAAPRLRTPADADAVADEVGLRRGEPRTEDVQELVELAVADRIERRVDAIFRGVNEPTVGHRTADGSTRALTPDTRTRDVTIEIEATRERFLRLAPFMPASVPQYLLEEDASATGEGPQILVRFTRVPGDANGSETRLADGGEAQPWHHVRLALQSEEPDNPDGRLILHWGIDGGPMEPVPGDWDERHVDSVNRRFETIMDRRRRQAAAALTTTTPAPAVARVRNAMRATFEEALQERRHMTIEDANPYSGVILRNRTKQDIVNHVAPLVPPGRLTHRDVLYPINGRFGKKEIWELQPGGHAASGKAFSFTEPGDPRLHTVRTGYGAPRGNPDAAAVLQCQIDDGEWQAVPGSYTEEDVLRTEAEFGRLENEVRLAQPNDDALIRRAQALPRPAPTAAGRRLAYYLVDNIRFDAGGTATGRLSDLRVRITGASRDQVIRRIAPTLYAGDGHWAAVTRAGDMPSYQPGSAPTSIRW